jgi:hypothetical protein
MHVLSDGLGGLLRLLVRLTLLVAGAVFFVSLLLAGIAVAGAYMLWSLLRGRKPTLQDILRFQRGRGSWAGRFGTGSGTGHGRRPTASAAAGDVVEVQAREITHAAR